MKPRDPITNLINHLTRLPGIGEKTAARLAFHVMNAPESFAHGLADALINVKKEIRMCSRCCNLTESDPCAVCASARRDASTVCVVGKPQDLRAIESTGEYRGLFHVLHGVLSPLEGIGPDDIRIKELVARLHSSSQDTVEEIIVATNPTTDGETTALYISRLLSPFDVKVTRIAFGIPMGGDLEYTDKVTLSRALAGRREI
jgi:recombination protein RecR